MADPQTSGVLYIAPGVRYYNEATQSARSLRRAMPEMPIAVVVSTEVEVDNSLFSHTIVSETFTGGFLDKINFIPKSPFDKTCYLDPDTYVAQDFSDVFNLLDDYDLCMVHDMPWRTSADVDGIPSCFPEWNGGVIFYAKDRLEQFFVEWRQFYESGKGRWKNIRLFSDQVALRETCYKLRPKIFTLTPEYNCRFDFLGSLSGLVVIFHGREWHGRVAELNTHDHLSTVVAAMNATHNPRIFADGTLRAYEFHEIPVDEYKASRIVRYYGNRPLKYLKLLKQISRTKGGIWDFCGLCLKTLKRKLSGSPLRD